MRDLVRALSILASNGAIVLGTMQADLGLAEALFLYWFEGVIASLCVLRLIVCHRAATRKRGHFYPDSLYEKQRTAAIAALVAALLLCGFAFLLPGQSHLLAAANVGSALVVMAVLVGIQAVTHLTERIGIRERSFGWITGRAQTRSGENLIILLSIAAGTAIYAVIPLGVAGIIALAVVKAILESIVLAASVNPKKLNDKPPALLRWFSRRKTQLERDADLKEWRAVRLRAVAAVEEGEQVLTEKQYGEALMR